MKNNDIRLDHRVILEMIDPETWVLDLGCGGGELLKLLSEHKRVKGTGIDIDENAIYSCVEKGLSATQGDIDSGLADYPDRSFDYVILNQSLQQITNLQIVLDDSLRVGKRVIVGFPNFAYWPARIRLFFRGKAPVTGALPYAWYDSPNKHFLSISDFADYCYNNRLRIEKAVYLGRKKCRKFLPNFFAEAAIFIIKK